MLLSMKRAQLIAVALAVVYFLLAFNAYACLLPMAVGVVMEQGSDCAKPQEQPARQQCEAYKSLGVQTASSALQAIDFSAHAIVAAVPPTLPSVLSPHKSTQPWNTSPPTEDILALTSVLRL